MAAQSERVVPDPGPDEVRPIELLTENGFRILRQWEIEGAANPAGGRYAFSVCDPDGNERLTVVEIAAELVTQIQIHTCHRILLSNSFWICCAERHLAVHLWEHGECPQNGKLHVKALMPADLNLSIRWERT